MNRMSEEEKTLFRHQNSDSAQPLFFMAFILQGTEQQYLDLLKYVQKWNQARLIYQKRSLVYLYVTDKEPVK